MQIGVVIEYDSNLAAGSVATSQTTSYKFAYAYGQSVLSGTDILCPVLSGRHEQGAGFRLKIPAVGDAVFFSLSSDGEEIGAWGYASHFVDTAKRRQLELLETN